MGTVVSLDVRGGSTDAVRGRAATRCTTSIARFSTYRADSEIRRLDRGELRARRRVRRTCARVLERCERAARARPAGSSTSRAGGRLDPSALVKGWAVAARRRPARRAGGLTDFCLSVGGDVVTRGDALPRAGWTVGIQHPHDRAAVAARVQARDLAVATSGAYERGAHIRRPAHPRRPDARALGDGHRPRPRDRRRLQHRRVRDGRRRPGAGRSGLDGYEAMTILADGTVLRTPGFPAGGRVSGGSLWAGRAAGWRRRAGRARRDAVARRARRAAPPRAARATAAPRRAPTGAAPGAPCVRRRAARAAAAARRRRPRRRSPGSGWASRSRSGSPPRAPARCAPTAGSRPRRAPDRARRGLRDGRRRRARRPLRAARARRRPGPARALAPQARAVAAVPAHRARRADHRRLRAGRARRRAAPVRPAAVDLSRHPRRDRRRSRC